MYGFIYLTTNKVNKKKYIGKKTYDKRGIWKSYLGSGVVLKSAIKKHGIDNFEREILEECEDESVLNEREKYWINFFNATQNHEFYNIAIGGDGGNVISGYSDEKRDKLKELHRTLALEYIPRGEDGWTSILKEEDVLYIIDKLIKNEEYIIDISKTFGVSVGTINDIKNHKTWKHLTNDIEFPTYIKKKSDVSKPVVQYDMNGNVVGKYKNAREAESLTGIKYKNISQVCNGDKKQALGFVFRFEGDSFSKYDCKNSRKIKVYQYTLNDEFIRSFDTIKEAQDFIGGYRIDNALKSKTHISHGYKWYKNLKV